jgi:ATP-dependent helicase HrpA
MSLELICESRIDLALGSDRPRLRERLRSIRRAQRAGKPHDRNLGQFAADLARSIERRAARTAALPQVTFDEELPIAARRAEIADAIARHQVVIVCGETGSGKSTQLPKICLTLGRGVDGLIGHTQPRRIAARSIATRVAAELGGPLGRHVGYKVRFTDATQPDAYIKLMTDGILLAESQHDRYLNQYDTLIIDEAHERSLNIDFLLGYLRRILPRRPELKVIVTSATLDAERISRFFGSDDRPAPIVAVAGRTYPVEIRYRPLGADAGLAAIENGLANEGSTGGASGTQGNGNLASGQSTWSSEPDLQRSIVAAVKELASIDNGDILIFLPTEQEIHATAKALRGCTLPGDAPSRTTEILPLYARLPTKEQQLVFERHTHRRIVLATNVAESSLTVPGVRYVIDTGVARINRYAARSKVQRLPIEPISQASADQRAGRCGRVGPGVCVRLYSADDYAERPRHTPPEIQRSNLAGVILQAKALGLGPLEDFPLLDAPRPESVRDGYSTLFELGAICERKELTDIGRKLARLPVDPRIGRLILAGADENCLTEILVIAAALATPEVRDRPRDRQEAADAAHAQFADEQSDFLSYWKCWTFLRDIKAQLSRNKFQKACQDNFLSPTRVREWQEAHRQLARAAAAADLHEQPPQRDASAAIHRAITTAFLANIAHRTGGAPGEYATAGGGRAFLWPGSAAWSNPPKWLVAGEVVETSRRYLRVAARIERQWIEQLAPHLLKRSYHDPHWAPDQSAAMVFENASLNGLRVVHRRRRPLSQIDASHARELFLFAGLVRGGYSTRARFLSQNAELLAELEQLERRSRRKGFLLGHEARYAFYDERIPADVVDGRSFERWRRQAEHVEPRKLMMTAADLTRTGETPLSAADYPDALFVRSLRLPLDYVFEPGSERDGVTLTVPRDAFRELDPLRLEWLVPGLLHEKVLALLKTLPKESRRRLIPMNESAATINSQIGFGDGSLLWNVAQAASRLASESISPDTFRPERLPDYLRLRLRIVDDSGRTLAVGRDVGRLRKRLWSDGFAHETISAVYLDGELWNRGGLTSWSFGELPDEIHLPEQDCTLVGYPAVVDEQHSVALELVSSPELAKRVSGRGVRRLVVLADGATLNRQIAWLPGWGTIVEQASSLMSERELTLELVDLLAEWAYLAVNRTPRDAEEFAACLENGRSRLSLVVQELADFVGPLFAAYDKVQRELALAADPSWKYALADMSGQLAELLRPGFLTITPPRWLSQIPRYLGGISARLERLAANNVAADEACFAELHPRWLNALALGADHRAAGRYDPALEEYRWLLEEYRLQLFAPTWAAAAGDLSKRLDALWLRTQQV